MRLGTSFGVQPGARRPATKAGRCLGATFLVLALVPWAAQADKPSDPPPERDPTALGIPFERYFTPDRFGRTITFYLSVAPAAKAPLPLALYIQGSGCQSLFKKAGHGVAGGYQNLLRDVAQGRARVLVVEKSGVKYLDEAQRAGTALGASREFLEEHTLPRWAEANAAAVRAAHTLPGVDPSRTLVLGHSEGGIVAARVAAEEPRVTHVASLAGGGPTQLFSLAELARRGRLGDPAKDAETRVRQVYEGWAQIRADPDSVTRFLWGHPHRRWSSFLKSSVTEELLRSQARVYLAQGTEDASSPLAAFDVLYAELLTRGRDVTGERIEGADHGFRPKGASGPPAEMKALLGRVVDWFVNSGSAPAGRPGATGERKAGT